MRIKRALGVVCALPACLVALPAARQNPTSVFRSGVRTVAVYATVHDRDGRLVPDLTKGDFQILDDGRPTEVTTFSSDILPFTAVLLLDMSSSMVPDWFRVRASAYKFVQAMLPADRVRIGTFGREVALSPLLTSDKAVLARILQEELWPGGGTPMWRAATEGMDSLAKESGRRVILLLTDGLDGPRDNDCAPPTFDTHGAVGACPGRAEVHKQALDGEFMFYAIGMAGAGVDAGLVDLATDTGGGHIALKRDTDLDAAFERVADELHRQYVLGFTPAVLDGRTHKLEVRLKKPGMTATARKSYVAEAVR